MFIHFSPPSMRAKYPSHPSVFGERVGMGVSACQHQDQALALYALYKFVFSYAYRQTFPITSNIYEDSSLLRCDAVCIANFLPTSWRPLLPLLSGQLKFCFSSTTQKMEAARSSKTLVTNHPSTRRHVSQHQQRCGKLKSRNKCLLIENKNILTRTSQLSSHCAYNLRSLNLVTRDNMTPSLLNV